MASLKQKGTIKINTNLCYSGVWPDSITCAKGFCHLCCRLYLVMTISFVLPGNPKSTLLTGSNGGRVGLHFCNEVTAPQA